MIKLLADKTVLFIAPVFYGYEKIIAQQIKRSGASVIFYPEREDGLKYKFVNNFKQANITKLQEDYYSNIYQQIKNIKIDYLFIIKGFLMPLSFIEKIKSRFPQALLIMHQWDSMKNYNYERYLNQFDKFFSFDPLDCRKYPILKYLPNFYLPEYATQQKQKPVYDISFIGWAYEDRIQTLKKIIVQLPSKSIFKHFYISPLGYIKNMLKGNFLRGAKVHSLSLANVFKIVQQSFSVLDIADANQSGYTYRTIDAMAAGKKLITTNTYIRFEKFYNEKNILFIDRNNPKINPGFFESPFEMVNIEEYSLDNWIKKVFTDDDKYLL